MTDPDDIRDKREAAFWRALRHGTGLTDEELARFDAASNHPYECQCELCEEWWSLVPPEDAEYDDPPEPDPDEAYDSKKCDPQDPWWLDD